MNKEIMDLLKCLTFHGEEAHEHVEFYAQEIERLIDANSQKCWDNGVEWCKMHHPETWKSKYQIAGEVLHEWGAAPFAGDFPQYVTRKLSQLEEE